MLYKGDKKARLYKGDAHPAEWYKGGDKITGFTTESKSGEHIEFADSYNGKFDELTVYGMSEQKSYAGTNLFDTKQLRNAVPALFTINDDGSVTIKGTTASRFVNVQSYWIRRNFGSYTIVNDSDDPEVWVGVYLSKDGTDGTLNQQYKYGKGTQVVTLSETEYPYIRLVIGCRKPKEYNVTIHPQFNLGTTALEYEPYVGGRAAPNMDFPQPIVDLEAETKVSDGNLLLSNYFIGSQNYAQISMPENPNTSLRVIRCDAKSSPNTNSNAGVAFCANWPYYGGNAYKPQFHKGDIVTISAEIKGDFTTATADSAKIITFYTNENGSIWNGVVSLRFDKRNYEDWTRISGTMVVPNGYDEEVNRLNFCIAGEGCIFYVRRVRIEYGDIAHPWSPNDNPRIYEHTVVGRAIPCTSDTEQHANYTDAQGKKYVADIIDYAHGKVIQNVGEYIVTGNESISQSTTSDTSPGMSRFWFPAALTPMVAYAPCLCNYLKYNGRYAGWRNKEGIVTDSAINFELFKTTADTIGQFKTWLASKYASGNPMRILYMKANPTTVPIDTYFGTLFPTTIIDSNTDRVTATAKVVDGGTT